MNLDNLDVALYTLAILTALIFAAIAHRQHRHPPVIDHQHPALRGDRLDQWLQAPHWQERCACGRYGLRPWAHRRAIIVLGTDHNRHEPHRCYPISEDA